jgi:hypothetical protein
MAFVSWQGGEGCKQAKANNMFITEHETERKLVDAPRMVIDIDLHAWRAAVGKLSLKETGELVRALVRAQGLPRPNREQRMLLAVFTRPQAEDRIDDEVAP